MHGQVAPAAGSGDPPGVDPSQQYNMYVISDIHIGSTWTSAERLRQVFQFLEYVASVERSRARLLVLLGDVVELWQAPFDEVPPTFAEVARRADFRTFARLLRSVLDARVRVFYVVGNHDFSVTAEDLREHVDGRVEFVAGRLEAVEGAILEHGHAHDLFNRVSDFDVRARLAFNARFVQPLGYWLCRADRTREKLGEDRNASTNVPAQVADVLSWCLDIASRALPGRPLLELMFSVALGRPWHDVKAIPISERGRSFLRPTLHVTLDQVVEAWEGVFDAARAKGGPDYLRNSVEAALGSYKDIFETYPENRLIVFGHTHEPSGGFFGNRFYLNSGGFVDDIKEAGTFLCVELERIPQLRLRSVPDGTPPAQPLQWLDAGKMRSVVLEETLGARIFASFAGACRGLRFCSGALPSSAASRCVAGGHVRGALALLPLDKLLPSLAARAEAALPGPPACCMNCGKGDLVSADLVVRFLCPKCGQTAPLRLLVERRPKRPEVRRLACSAKRCGHVYLEPPPGAPPLSALDLLVSFLRLLAAPWRSADPANKTIRGENVYPFVLSLQSSFPSLLLSSPESGGGAPAAGGSAAAAAAAAAVTGGPGPGPGAAAPEAIVPLVEEAQGPAGSTLPPGPADGAAPGAAAVTHSPQH